MFSEGLVRGIQGFCFGGVAFGWEPDNPVADEPKAAAAAPAISAATFPLVRKP